MQSFIVKRDACSHHEIFPGVNIYTAAGESMMLSLVEFEPGAVVEPHSHPHEQVGLLIEGELTFTIGDHQETVQPGDMWRIPGDVVHSAVAGEAPVKAVDIFHPVRQDYL